MTQKIYIKESFECVHWAMEIYWILPGTPRSSTTVITLVYSPAKKHQIILKILNPSDHCGNAKGSPHSCQVLALCTEWCPIYEYFYFEGSTAV